MATKIIHKKSSVADSIPVDADIAPGELALNLADRKIYSKQTDGTIVEMAPQAEVNIASLGSWTLGSTSGEEWAIVEVSGVVMFKFGTTVAMTAESSGELNIAGDLYEGATVAGTTVQQDSTEWSYNPHLTSLYFQYGNNNVMQLTSTGDLYIEGDLNTAATVAGNTSTSYYFSFSGTAKVELETTGDLTLVGDLDTNANI